MYRRIAISLMLLAVSSVADSGLFPYIRSRDSITLILPSGECRGKVVTPGSDRLIVRLGKKRAACSVGGSLVTVSRADVRDIERNRPWHGPGDSQVPFCAANALFIGGPLAYAIGEKTQSDGAALLALFGSAAVGGFLCRDRSARYTVVTDRVTPMLPESPPRYPVR